MEECDTPLLPFLARSIVRSGCWDVWIIKHGTVRIQKKVMNNNGVEEVSIRQGGFDNINERHCIDKC